MTKPFDQAVVTLDKETRAAIREGLEQAKRGEFVPDEEIAALWERHLGPSSQVRQDRK
jgi:predicted transcriptional regulator